VKKLAIVTTHPIQYNAPLFRLLTARENIRLQVFYTWSQAADGPLYDPGFGIKRNWDLPLLEGYEYSFIPNVSPKPGSHHFWGIINPSLIDAVEAYNPEVILIYGWNFHSHLKLMKSQKGKRTILFRGDSTLLDEKKKFNAKKLFRRLILKNIYRYVDLALYVGANNRQYFLQHGLKPNQLIYAPHCIDNERFGTENEHFEKLASKWRIELGIQPYHICFLFAGKLEVKKGIDVLIDSFLKLQKANTRLIIAGNGHLEAKLKAKASHNLRIIFIPFQNQRIMPVLYRVSDVFVLPSRGPGETWGLGLNEAMACGRAVIASDKCGGANDLIDSSNGMIFRAEDSTELLECLRKCTETNLVKVMGIRSAEKIKDFNFASLAMRIEDTVCDYEI